jgi:hypothetical protein
MVRQQHGLGMLHMRAAGENDIHVVFRERDEFGL